MAATGVNCPRRCPSRKISNRIGIGASAPPPRRSLSGATKAAPPPQSGDATATPADPTGPPPAGKASGEGRLPRGGDRDFVAAASSAEADLVIELAGQGNDVLDFSAVPAGDNVAVHPGNDLMFVTIANRSVSTGAAEQSSNFESVLGSGGNDILP
jgi:hypothetical protein